MGNGIELAKAYVQIVPSAEGIQGKITEALGGESSKAGDAAGQLLGKKLVGAVAKVISAAGIGKILAESIASGGALQQSLGGVETLFKDSADKVKSYAAQAYKTVGLSANAYMEQTTSFAASLLASVSHDTNAAAELANMAMVDMADNANKMGTDMQDIQNAYQGFAKQNYTMLDNLKLGYGGTQAEMQRLLQDAEKISGVHYDLGNLADMYSAIHVIQQEMDITGTTAKEATTTLTGSFSAMSAAFQNVLSSLSTGADLSAPLAALVETSKTYLVDNLLPMVGNVLASIPEVVYSLVPQLLQSGTELVNSLASGFAEGIPEFFSNALPQLLVFTEQLRANAGSFVDAGLNLITQLLNGLIAGLPQLIAYAPDIIINLAGIINDNMPKILAEGISIVVQLAAGIIQAFPSLLANWKKIFQAILSVISAINWVSLGANILKGIGNGIKSMGSSLLEAFKGGFSSALNWIKNLPAQAVQWGKNLIKSFTNGLTGKGGAVGIGSILGTAGASIAENAKGSSKIDWAATWADANDDLANSAQAVADIAIPAYTKSGNAATTAAEKAKSAAKTVSETLLWSLQDAGHSESTNALGKVTTQTTELTEHLRKGSEEYDRVTRTVTESGKELVNGVVKNYKEVTRYVTEQGKTTAQTQKTYEEIAATVRDTVTSTFDTVQNGIKTTTQTVTKTLADGTTEQQQVITQTQDKVIDGALRTVETVKTIAADGTEQVAETIKDSAADTLDGLWSEIKDRASEGVLGTVDTLWDAVKSGDWVGIGKWAASALYSGLTADQKQQLTSYALSLVDTLNGVLGDAAGSLAQVAWGIGQSLFEGITGKFGDISSMAVKMGGTLKSVFGTLKAPLAAAAKAISAGLSGGLLSMFPAIYAGFAGMIGTIGAAVEGMLAAISAALTSTLFGIPAGLVVAAAAVALGVAIAAIVSKLGGSHSSSGGSGGSGGGGGGGSGLGIDTPSITDGSNKLTDTIDANTAKLTEINKSLAKLVKSANALVLSDNMAVSSRVAASGTAQVAAAARSYREGDVHITQHIYSKAQTAADLQREARWEADRGLAQKR